MFVLPYQLSFKFDVSDLQENDYVHILDSGGCLHYVGSIINKKSTDRIKVEIADTGGVVLEFLKIDGVWCWEGKVGRKLFLEWAL